MSSSADSSSSTKLITSWVNIYKDIDTGVYGTGCMYETEDAAKKQATKNPKYTMYIDTVPVQFKAPNQLPQLGVTNNGKLSIHT